MDHHPTQEVALEVLPGSRENIRIIKVRGPLTIHNFFEFQDLSRQQPEDTTLLIDLTEVPYMDSAALGSILGIHVSCGKANRKYGLVNTNERLLKLFAMTGVEKVLVIYGSVAEAEAALAS